MILTDGSDLIPSNNIFSETLSNFLDALPETFSRWSLILISLVLKDSFIRERLVSKLLDMRLFGSLLDLLVLSFKSFLLVTSVGIFHPVD